MLKGLLTAAAALALVGCQASEPTPAPSPAVTASASPTVSSPTPTESPSPSASESPTAFESFPPLPEDATADELAALQAWMEYSEVVDWYLKHPDATDLTDVQRVTLSGSEAAESTFQMISTYRENGWRLSGDSQYRDVRVELEGSDASSATVSYCFDASDNEVLEATSGELAVASKDPMALERATLQRLEDGTWRVTMVRNEVVTC